MDINLDKVAVLIVDMQNGGCKAGGSLIEMIQVKEDRATSTYEPINQIREWAYQNNRPVIYVKTIFEKDYSNGGLMAKKFPIQAFNHFVKDTWDSEVVDELAMKKQDLLVIKDRWSSFYNTNLDELLSDLGIEQIILTGTATEVCLLETATDAFFRDIECFVPKETTFSFFKENEDIGFAQLNFGRANVCSVDDIIK